MSWFGWILLVLFVLGAAASVIQIGKPRDAITNRAALFIIGWNALLIWGLLAVGV